jgi:hypothetical protein
MLPTPKKEKVELTEIVNNGLEIMCPLFKKEKIEVQNTMLLPKNQTRFSHNLR